MSIINFDKNVFTLTEDHLKLLHKVYCEWQDFEAGAPAVNCKRPYGNGDYLSDIAEILEWDLFVDHNGEKHMTSQQFLTAERLHQETFYALSIVLRTGEFKAGTYQREAYGQDWKAA